MSYRNDVDALAARHEALAAEVEAKTRELGDAARLLDEAKQRAKLPVLPNIRVATPCRADWNQMTGDERVRACGACNKNVYNLSSMTRDEAEALIVEKEGKLCVRYFQRADGTILLKDCAVGVSQKRKRRLIAAGAAALLGAGGLIAYELADREVARVITTPEDQADMMRQFEQERRRGEPPPREVMGGITAAVREVKGDVTIAPKVEQDEHVLRAAARYGRSAGD